MKAEIALITVSGKAYYLLVNELKTRGLLFLSLMPGDNVPMEIRVAITTKDERHLVNHPNILIYEEGVDPATVIDDAVRIIQGKVSYGKVTIGIDPGKTFGLAILGDGKILETTNCLTQEEVANKILVFLKKAHTLLATVRVGDGVPAYAEKLLHVLDKMLPENVVIELVSETGTSRSTDGMKHTRELRNIGSAIKIANRNGSILPREKIA